MCPGVDNLVVTLVLSDEAHAIVVLDGTNFVLTALHNLLLFWRDDDVVKVERQTSDVCHAVTEVLDAVEELAGTSHTDSLDYAGDDATQGLLRDDVVEEAYLIGYNLVHDDTTYRGLHHAGLELAVYEVGDNDLYRSVEVALALVVGDDGLFSTVECQTCALSTGTELGDIIESEHHIL